MPSITGWTRLEPRPRSQDFSLALQARLRDPLWMLARQWQVGEFQGEDAGSPVAARLEMGISLVNRFRAGSQENASPYDAQRMPLEALVEGEALFTPGAADLRLAAQAGLHFLRLLKTNGLDEAYRQDYLDQYPLPELPDLDPESRRFLAVMRGRAPDGARLSLDLRQALSADPPALPTAPEIDPGDRPAALAAALSWLAWWDGFFLQPAAGQNSWAAEKMECRFQVSAPDGEQESVLAAREYYHGHLDWYSFDLQREGALGGEAGPGGEHTLIHSVVPTGVDFGGMPASRWWEFEDGRVDFGRVDAAPEDLARLLLLEFAMVYGDDWLLIPVRLEVGSLCRIRSLVVTDTFGERVVIPPSAQPADPAASWGLFYLAESGQPLSRRLAPAEQTFFLPPSLASSLESPPLEEVLLVRDEMANLAWAIERTVLGAAGRPVDRFEAYQEKQRQAPVSTPPAAEAAVVYHLASSIPDHWIPLLPVRLGEDQRSIALQRGAMLDPETGQGVLPQGKFLTPGQRLIIDDEDVSRVGTRLKRLYQYARWTQGQSFLWLGRQKQFGRGEASSGLRFDSL